MNSAKTITILSFISLILFLTNTLLSEEIDQNKNSKPTYDIPLITTPPSIDGKFSSENEWSEMKKLDNYYQINPGYNITPSENTEFYIGHDKDNIYFMAKCDMKNISEIRNFHCSRDKIYKTDRVLIYLDTFNSSDKAYYISTNINGEQADGIVGTNMMDTSVDLMFTSRGGMTETGFMLELSLPLKSIKYKSGENIDWGFFIKRVVMDKNEEISATKTNRESANYFDNYGTLKFKSLEAKQNLKIAPGIITNYEEHKNSTTGKMEGTENFDAELNIFYEPTPEITITATINPDFSAIETDALNVQVNSRYAAYYSEKRPFFIEDSNPFSSLINIYHTRQIYDPVVGVKFSGNFDNGHSLFGLVAIDEDVSINNFYDTDSDKTDNTVFGFSSISKKLGNQGSKIRLAGALRNIDKYLSANFSIDNNFSFLNNFDFAWQFISSVNEQYIPEENEEATLSMAYSTELKFNNENFFAMFKNKYIKDDFTADLGFISETDVGQYYNHTEYHYKPKNDKSFVRYFEAGWDANLKYTYDHKDVKSYGINPFIGAVYAKNIDTWLGFEANYENFGGVEDNFTFVPWIDFGISTFEKVSGGITFVTGETMWYYDLDDDEKPIINPYTKIKPRINFQPTSDIFFEISGKYEELDKVYISRSAELNAKYQFNKNFWLKATVQYTYNNYTIWEEKYKDLSIYPLFVYKPNANIALYLGATAFGEPETKTPFIDATDTNYFLKAKYTFNVI